MHEMWTVVIDDLGHLSFISVSICLQTQLNGVDAPVDPRNIVLDWRMEDHDMSTDSVWPSPDYFGHSFLYFLYLFQSFVMSVLFVVVYRLSAG